MPPRHPLSPGTFRAPPLGLAGLEEAHEGEDGGTVALARLLIGVEAQADVVVAPDAHGPDLLKQANPLLDPLARSNTSPGPRSGRPGAVGARRWPVAVPSSARGCRPIVPA